jgi:hypothetical protein
MARKNAMATVKKGTLTPASEWWKHLRWSKPLFWKVERRNAKEAAAKDANER